MDVLALIGKNEIKTLSRCIVLWNQQNRLYNKAQYNAINSSKNHTMVLKIH